MVYQEEETQALTKEQFAKAIRLAPQVIDNVQSYGDVCRLVARALLQLHDTVVEANDSLGKAANLADDHAAHCIELRDKMSAAGMSRDAYVEDRKAALAASIAVRIRALKDS